MCLVLAVDGSYSDRQIPNSYAGTPANDIRQSQIFHGYSSFPTSTTSASMPPSLHDGMNSLGPHSSSSTAVVTAVPKTEDDDRNTTIYGDLPEGKRRKFILVNDTDSDPHKRVRVRVTLDQVDMLEMPDSYRKRESVFPRSYYPTQMQSPPSSARGNRFFDDDDPDGGEIDNVKPTRGRTFVPVPLLDGGEGELAVPKLSRAKKRKEVTLNDLGYRMSWSQSRVFAGRTMFLQKSRKHQQSTGGLKRFD